MAARNEAVKNSGNRAHPVNLFNLRGSGHYSSASPSTARHSRVQQVLNNASSNNPLSYTSLLTAAYGDHNGLPIDIKNQIEDINRINTIHNEHLRQELEGLVGKAVEKLKEKEAELQQKTGEYEELEKVMTQYRTEVGRLQTRVRYLEQQAAKSVTVRSGLQEGSATSRGSGTGKEEEGVKAVKLECKACKEEMATVMMWPCRHVCLCRRCNSALTYCPVCFLMKTSSLEVFLSPSN